LGRNSKSIKNLLLIALTVAVLALAAVFIWIIYSDISSREQSPAQRLNEHVYDAVQYYLAGRYEASKQALNRFRNEKTISRADLRYALRVIKSLCDKMNEYNWARTLLLALREKIQTEEQDAMLAYISIKSGESLVSLQLQEKKRYSLASMEALRNFSLVNAGLYSQLLADNPAYNLLDTLGKSRIFLQTTDFNEEIYQSILETARLYRIPSLYLNTELIRQSTDLTQRPESLDYEEYQLIYDFFPEALSYLLYDGMTESEKFQDYALRIIKPDNYELRILQEDLYYREFLSSGDTRVFDLSREMIDEMPEASVIPWLRLAHARLLTPEDISAFIRTFSEQPQELIRIFPIFLEQGTELPDLNALNQDYGLWSIKLDGDLQIQSIKNLLWEWYWEDQYDRSIAEALSWYLVSSRDLESLNTFLELHREIDPDASFVYFYSAVAQMLSDNLYDAELILQEHPWREADYNLLRIYESQNRSQDVIDLGRILMEDPMPDEVLEILALGFGRAGDFERYSELLDRIRDPEIKSKVQYFISAD
jgi:hypothetical protein